MFDKTSYIKNVHLQFSKIKQKYPDRVEKCYQNITEHNISDRLDFFYNRAPSEIAEALQKLTNKQVREFIIKDLILDNIILPEDEKLFKERISRLETVDIKDTVEDIEKELLDRIFGFGKDKEY